MNRPRRHGCRPQLSRRSLACLGLAAALITGLAASLAMLAQHQQLRQDSEGALTQLIRVTGGSSAAAAQLGDKTGLQALLDDLAAHPLVAQVQASDAQGRPLAQATAESPPRARSAPGDAARPGLQVLRHLASPSDASRRVATITVVADGPALARQERQHASVLLLALVAQMIGLLALPMIVASRLQSQPLARLAQAMSLLSPDKPQRLATASPRAGSDYRRVATAINQLLDLSGRAQAAERVLRAQVESMQARYRPIFEVDSIGIFVCSLDGQVLSANPAMRRLLGPVSAAPDGHGIALPGMLKEPDEWPRLLARARLSEHPVTTELALLPAAGRPAWVQCRIAFSARPSAQGLALIEGAMHDIDARAVPNPSTTAEARHDQLTGLLNRQGIETYTGHLLKQAAAMALPFTLLQVDLEGLHRIHAEQGQAVVDEMLVACAERLRRQLRRASDLLGRLGDDSFLIGLSGVDAQDRLATLLAERVQLELARPIRLRSGAELSLSAHVGLASFPRDAQHREGLMRTAEHAAKGARREAASTAVRVH